MNFDVAIDERDSFIRVTLSGAPSIGQVLSMIHLLGVQSETWEKHVVLVDLRAVTTPFTREDQFRIGEDAAACLSHMDRIASVVPAERITRISERAARRNGIDIRVFDDESAAIAWLREG